MYDISYTKTCVCTSCSKAKPQVIEIEKCARWHRFTFTLLFLGTYKGLTPCLCIFFGFEILPTLTIELFCNANNAFKMLKKNVKHNNGKR